MSSAVSELSDPSADNDGSSSYELDDLPLLQRRNLLLTGCRALPIPHTSGFPLVALASSDAAAERDGGEVSVLPYDDLDLKHKHMRLQLAPPPSNHAPVPANGIKILKLWNTPEVKVEHSSENGLLGHQMPSLLRSDAVLAERRGMFKVDDGWSDELDHMPLVHRRKLLLLNRQHLLKDETYSIVSPVCERPSTIHHDFSVKEEEEHFNSQLHCPNRAIGQDLADLAAGKEKLIQPGCEDAETGNKLCGDVEIHSSDVCRSIATVIPDGTHVGVSWGENQCTLVSDYAEVKVVESTKLSFNVEAQTSEGASSLKRKFSKPKRLCRSDHVPLNTKAFSNSSFGTAIYVKIEPSDCGVMLDKRCESMDNITFNSSSVKREEDVHDLVEDKLDHMLLQERMNLQTSADSRSDHLKNCDWLSRALPTSQKIPTVVESVKPISIKRSQKRRKTVTDSVETALEEDAPGLLRVLLDKGVSLDEIKLYGDMGDDDTLDDSSEIDGFAELEDVIYKLFSQRDTLLKFGRIKSGKDAKITYCLACLFSLVEQTRYLQFRKWPVEWGWCRDLRSFLFVFERHKRIVLERPEYGYATYFFELVDSLPIAWQIKRLVIAMKLTSCSRISLMENKPLMVGEDLTEGEARVLMEYGWRPNSGLGTMLNYCSRVYHDRQDEIEKDTSEWRAKIGKLLMDGYNGGAIISSSIVKAAMEYGSPSSGDVKLES